ncbi:cytochrome C biogenesis protein [Afipia sp. P52-10]|uniref:cytochrome c biogenesis CcdA family protein n=1 Tax=Afipia sp. P52-10 TaxID=1429916 RepID=UPI0003DF2A86|nr:cytochrome c biogenesis protein CcdA [Afipia sp. P52-10]ETR79377.1 cytochrome C biogenesis protein [Afipia sp. P52-10]
MTTTLAFLAGVLSILSPCVLPLVPIVLGAAVSEHRFGPAALAVGLAISFVAIGMFVATVGFAIGLDGAFFRMVGGALLTSLGLVLLVPRFQVVFATAAGPVSDWTERRFGGFSQKGLSGQFGLGLLLGAVWSPCVGPTLGAASVLAAQGEDLGHVALTMGTFGLGAALPLLALGLLSREAILRWRGRMLSAGSGMKAALGAMLLAAGVLVLTGLDKVLEAAMIRSAPSWLIDLTTRF